MVRFRCGQVVYLAPGDDGERKADDVDVVGQHLLGHLAGEASVAQHHRADRVSVITQHLRGRTNMHVCRSEGTVCTSKRNEQATYIEASLLHALPEARGVGLQLIPQLGRRAVFSDGDD
jgi:hypothetical protein